MVDRWGIVIQESLVDKIVQLNGTAVEDPFTLATTLTLTLTRTLQARVHVLLARTGPVLVKIDPEILVKHVVNADLRDFVVNGLKQQVQFFGWTALKGRLCLELSPDNMKQCKQLILQRAEKDIRWAVVSGFSSIFGRERLMSTGTDSSPHLEDDACNWELYGLDFSLVWSPDDLIQAKLLDWNFRPSVNIHPPPSGRLMLPLMREVYNTVRHRGHETASHTSETRGRLETLVGPNGVFCPTGKWPRFSFK